jgi:hypothetical protein
MRLPLLRVRDAIGHRPQENARALQPFIAMASDLRIGYG